MRIFLLPISTRQSLIYCQRLHLPAAGGGNIAKNTKDNASLLDKITTRANNTWLSWEQKDSGWQKKVTEYGNKLFQRLPHEEWGLKSIPPLRAAQKGDEAEHRQTVSVEYPGGFIQESRVLETLRKLGSEQKQGFHLKWLLASLAGMPLSAPIALIPIIPNLPFFYLCFRAWSHWRARAGSQHIEYLMQNQLLKPHPSYALRTAYNSVTMDTTLQHLRQEVLDRSEKKKDSASSAEKADKMLLATSNGRIVAEQVGAPVLEVEIERAIWQVERDIEAYKEKAVSGAAKQS